MRVRRQQQIVVGLLGVSFLRAWAHDDATGEHAARMIIEHAVEVLMTRTMVGGVVDRRMMVRVLPPGEQIEAVENQRATRSRHNGSDIMPRQDSAERDRMKVNGAVAPLMCLRRGDVIRARTLSLHTMIVDPGTVAGAERADCVRPR